MKQFKLKPHATLWALVALGSPALQAQVPISNTGMYMGISAGESKAHIDNPGIAQNLLAPGLSVNALTQDQRGAGYKAFVGFPLSPNWAVETGYFDLGRFGFGAQTTPLGTLSGTSRIQGLNLDLVGSLPITERWSVLGRLGAAYAQTKSNFNGTGAVVGTNPDTRKRETNYKYGLGTRYALTPELSMHLDGERYRVNDAVGQRANVDLISVGLLYRFGGPTVSKAVYKPYVPPVAAPVYKEPVAVAQAPMPVAPAAPQPWVKVKLAADSLFGFDQDTLQADGKQALDKLIMELKGVNVDMIQVTGHTDRLGSKAYNAKLSQRRAEVVRNYLVQVGGISPGKVTATGVGSSQPDTALGDCQGMKASQALITCLRVDRRVEVEVTGSQAPR